MIYTYIFSLPTRCISYATRIRYIGFCLFWWTLAHPAAAQFTTLTSESLVNTTTSGDQWTYWWSIRTIAVQPSGGFIGVWIDHNGTDGQGDGIYCQRFDANGTKIGAETLVNTTTTGDQFSPALAVAPDGSYLVAWEGSSSGIDVWGQMFSKDGIKVGTEFLLNTTVSGNQRYPEIQFYPDGTFVAGFVDASQTVLQRFTADGRPIGLETRISSGTGDVIMDGLCVRPDNSLLVFWTSGGDVYGQLFTNNLTAIGIPTRLNAYTTGTQEYVVGRVDGQGNMFFSWQDQSQDGSGLGAYYRRFDSNLTPLSTNEVAVSSNTTGNQIEPQITVHPSGRFIITWADNNNRDGGGGDGSSVWFREFDATGNPVGVETMLNQTTLSTQDYPVIDMNKSGRFVIEFESNASGNFDVYARTYQLSQTGTTTLSVAPTIVTASDLITVTMRLTNPTDIANVKPCPLTIYGTNGVFATLVSGPTPSSATVGSSGTTFTWTYRVTAADQTGVLTFGGNAYNTTGSIFPFNTSNAITVKPSVYLSDMTSPNLVNDSNNPDQSPNVFTIGAKIINPSLNPLTNVVVYIGNGTTAGVFPTTTMSLSQTSNTYQGTFALSPLAGVGDGTRTIGTMGAAKSVIDGGIDFNGDGVVNTSDDGLLSNGKTVIDGRIDVDKNGSIGTTDDFSYPAGVFTGYREPNIIDGYVDNNRDGSITAADIGTYGGGVYNIYWQAVYAVKDANGQATYGNCGDFADDLRYNWTVWTSCYDGGTARNGSIEEFAKVRCEISAAANKITPNPTGYISGGPPRVLLGLVDINSDGIANMTDDGTYYGKTIIDGKVDIDGNGSITVADDGSVNGFPVINGSIDVNNDGLITLADNGILVQIGQTFSVTVHNATFGTVGAGFDANRDGLWDYDFWHQPVGESDWPSGSFRLVDIQSDVIGIGGNNPLNGITTHYDNEPYLSRLFDDRLGQSGGFNATYTYTFSATAAGNGFITPYQEAASGSNNEKYNGDYGIGVNVITGLPCPSVTVAPNTICTGGTATLTANVTGGSGLIYQWQQFITGNWTNIGTNTTTYTTPILNSSSDFRFIVTQTTTGCPTAIDTATISVVADPSVSVTTTAPSVCIGGNVTLNATPSGGTGTCTVQWQSSPNGTTWTDIFGATGNSFAPTNLSVTTRYRAQITCSGNGCCN